MVENFYYAKALYKSLGQKYIQIDVTSKVWYDFCKWVLLCQKEYRNYESSNRRYVINYEETSISNYGGRNGKPLRWTETD